MNENGIEIGGRFFEFVRVTISAQSKIIKRFDPSAFEFIKQKMNPSMNNLRMWKKVRSIAFVKTGLWKYLGIVPKELRCDQISLAKAGEAQASFFEYVAREVNDHDGHLKQLITSRIGTAQQK